VQLFYEHVLRTTNLWDFFCFFYLLLLFFFFYPQSAGQTILIFKHPEDSTQSMYCNYVEDNYVEDWTICEAILESST